MTHGAAAQALLTNLAGPTAEGAGGLPAILGPLTLTLFALSVCWLHLTFYVCIFTLLSWTHTDPILEITRPF